MALVALLYLVAIRGPLPRETEAQPPSLLRATMRAPRDPVFVALAALAFVFPLGIGLISISTVLYAKDMGVAESATGLVLAANGVLLALLAIPVARAIEPMGPFRLLGLSAALVALSFAVLGVLDHVLLALFVATVLFTLGEVIFSSAVPAAVAVLAPPGARGAYQGAWGMVFGPAVGAALLVSGALKERVGWSATWLAVAALTLVAGALLLATRGWFRRVGAARRATDPAP